MKETFFEFAFGQIKRTFPFFLTLFLVLIDFVPTHLPFSHFLRPDLALECLYFWILYRRDLFGIVSTIALGVVVDCLSGSPLGMHVLVFLFVYILTVTFSSYVNTKPFMLSWSGFAFVSFMAFFLKWGLFCVYYRVFLGIPHILAAYFVTVLVYPLIASLNIFIQNRYLKVEEDIDE